MWSLLLPAIGALGGMFSGAAKGSQEGRTNQDLANASIYRTRTEGELGKGQLDLAQNQYNMQAPGHRAQQVSLADLMMNMKDASVGGPGNWGASGGMRPSALGDMSKVAAMLAAKQHMGKLQTGEQLYQPNLGAPPQASKAGWFEKLLGGLGLAGGIVGGLQQGGLLGKPAAPQNPNALPPQMPPMTPGTDLFAGQIGEIPSRQLLNIGYQPPAGVGPVQYPPKR